MNKLKANAKQLQKLSYLVGLLIIVGTVIYGVATIGDELLESASSPEKHLFIEFIVSGIVLLIEGRLLTEIQKDQGKMLFVIFISAISTITLIVNTIWSGIGQYFNIYGIMDLAFCIINILILMTTLKIREKSQK